MAKQKYTGIKNDNGVGRDVSVDPSTADSISHLGGDDYFVVHNGHGVRISAPGTNVSDLHAGKKGKDDKD